jgi:hypothetical protein
MYGYSKWKNMTRPEKNEEPSFSMEQSNSITSNRHSKPKDATSISDQRMIEFSVSIPFMALASCMAHISQSTVFYPDRIWFRGRVYPEDSGGDVDIVVLGASSNGEDSFKSIIPSRGRIANGHGCIFQGNHSKEK